MKKFSLLSVLILSGILLFTSCKKPGHETKYITINETISAGNTYALDLSVYGDADDQPAITTQAANYVISQINVDAVTAKNKYNFSTNTKSQDKQTVVITLTENHGGRGGSGNCNHTEAVITINFTVL